MTEAQIHQAVIDHWRAVGMPGTLVATIPNAGAFGQPGLTRGLPDLIVMAPSLPVGFIELKTEQGTLSPYQKAFAERCAAMGVPYALTRGRDEPIAVLERWNVVRRPAA